MYVCCRWENYTLWCFPIYFSCVFFIFQETKINCVRLATKGMWVSLSCKTQYQKCKNCSGGTTWLQFLAKEPASLFPLLFFFLKEDWQARTTISRTTPLYLWPLIFFFFNTGYNSLWCLLPLVLLTAFLSRGLFLLLAEHQWKSDINFLFNLFSPQLYKADKRRSHVSLTLYTAGHNSYSMPFSWYNWRN